MIVMNLNPGQEKMMVRGKKGDQEGMKQSPILEKSKIRDEGTNCLHMGGILPPIVIEKEMITGVKQRDNAHITRYAHFASTQPGDSYHGF
jgi:hypothetical protein